MVKLTIISKGVHRTTLLEGHSHARHRKVMNPAFSAAQLRSFLPRFRNSTAKVSEMIEQDTMHHAHLLVRY